MDTLTLRGNVKLGLTFPLPFEKISSPCDIRIRLLGTFPNASGARLSGWAEAFFFIDCGGWFRSFGPGTSGRLKPQKLNQMRVTCVYRPALIGRGI
jgi:hypothetical protein